MIKGLLYLDHNYLRLSDHKNALIHQNSQRNSFETSELDQDAHNIQASVVTKGALVNFHVPLPRKML